jgi:hypothetical protein
MKKLKLYWLVAKKWLSEKYNSGEAVDLLIMIGIGICSLGLLSVILF